MKLNNTQMIKIEKIKITLLAVLISVHVSAKENINYPGISNVKNERVAAGCTPSTSQTDLDVNNEEQLSWVEEICGGI